MLIYMMHFCYKDSLICLQAVLTLVKYHIIGLHCLPKYLFAGVQNEKS